MRWNPTCMGVFEVMRGSVGAYAIPRHHTTHHITSHHTLHHTTDFSDLTFQLDSTVPSITSKIPIVDNSVECSQLYCSSPWVEILIGKLRFPMGAAATLSILLENNHKLLKYFATEDLITAVCLLISQKGAADR